MVDSGTIFAAIQNKALLSEECRVVGLVWVGFHAEDLEPVQIATANRGWVHGREKMESNTESIFEAVYD